MDLEKMDLKEIEKKRQKKRDAMRKYRESTSRQQLSIFIDSKSFGEMNLGIDLSGLSKTAFVSKAISLYCDQLYKESKK